MIKLILLALTFLFAFSQLVPTGNNQIVADYRFYSDIGSSQFQKVISFIHTNRPELKKFKPISVQTQNAGGINYRIRLQNAEDDCSCNFIVYSTYQGDIHIFKKSLIACPKTKPISDDSYISGGYTVLSNPSGEYFQVALKQTLARNLNFARSGLVLAETQLVSGTNYRFTFKDTQRTLRQFVMHLSQGEVVQSNGEGQFHPWTLFDGGWFRIQDPKYYGNALKAIYYEYPQVKSYYVSGVESPPRSPNIFSIGLQNNTGGYIRYAFFSVLIDRKGVATAKLLKWINVAGYTVPQLQENISDSLQLHNQLAGATLMWIENIWKKEGLNFVFKNGEKKQEVFIYIRNGKTNNLIF